MTNVSPELADISKFPELSVGFSCQTIDAKSVLNLKPYS